MVKKDSVYIEAFILSGCPYSRKAEEYLKKNDIPYKKIFVSQEDKNFYKERNNMPTFPQLFLSYYGKKIMIGGYDTLMELDNLYYTMKNSPIEQHINIINSQNIIPKKKNFLLIANLIYPSLIAKD